jgi:hypothetical protein
MPLYRVKPGKSVNQSGQIYTDRDDPIEVPVHIAFELRGVLEPVDKSGELPPPPESTVRQGPGMQEDLRDHERLTVLELQKAQLQKQMDYVDGQLEDVRTQIEERASRQKGGAKKDPPKSEQKETKARAAEEK